MFSVQGKEVSHTRGVTHGRAKTGILALALGREQRGEAPFHETRSAAKPLHNSH